MEMIYDMPLFRPPSEGENLIIQATPGNVQRKSVEDLALLREHKLNLLYFGIESASELTHLSLKPVTKSAGRCAPQLRKKFQWACFKSIGCFVDLRNNVH